jgi:hypothetical protein
VEPDEWDKWKLSKDYDWARTDPHVGNSYDYMAEIYKQITEHRLKVKSSIVNKNSTAVSSSNTKPKIKVDVSHMSKDVGADILQRVKQAYEDTNV